MNEVKLREVIESSLRAIPKDIQDNDYDAWAKHLANDIFKAQIEDAKKFVADMQQAKKCRHCGKEAGHAVHA